MTNPQSPDVKMSLWPRYVWMKPRNFRARIYLDPTTIDLVSKYPLVYGSVRNEGSGPNRCFILAKTLSGISVRSKGDSVPVSLSLASSE